MLTQLRLLNFKGWKDTKDVRLAPITIFFGGNSAGKTSILQFLLMLKQTAESPDRKRVLHLGDQHSLVELGSFRDIIHRHQIETKLEFSVTWQLPRPVEIVDSLSKLLFKADTIRFSAKVAADQRGTASIDRFNYELTSNNMQLGSIKVAMEPVKPTGRKYKLTATNFNLRRTVGRAWELPEPLRFYGFPDEVSSYYQNASFVSDLAFQLEKQMRSVSYLGPLREDPSRMYSWSGEVPDSVGSRGDRAIEAVLAAADRKIVPGYKKPGLAFTKIIARWLERLELLEGFSAHAIASGRNEFEVSVRTKNNMVDVLLPDVGFGVSQVLPVVVQCFYAPANSTVIIEQPELHLHPRVQSGLADLFIEAIHARENNYDRNMQFIIESHSEHFLRRIQLRIAEGNLDPGDVALYYCEPGSDGAKLRELPVNLFGEISDWPEEFFGDELGDLAARLTAASKREAISNA